MAGTVADSGDCRVAGRKVLVDEDTVRDLKTCRGCEIVVRNDANADQDEVGGKRAPILRLQSNGTTISTKHSRDRGTENKLDACFGMAILHVS